MKPSWVSVKAAAAWPFTRPAWAYAGLYGLALIGFTLAYHDLPNGFYHSTAGRDATTTVVEEDIYRQAMRELDAEFQPLVGTRFQFGSTTTTIDSVRLTDIVARDFRMGPSFRHPWTGVTEYNSPDGVYFNIGCRIFGHDARGRQLDVVSVGTVGIAKQSGMIEMQLIACYMRDEPQWLRNKLKR